MNSTNVGIGFIRDPLEWAAACEAQIGLETEPEARDALKQLAEEFKFAASEISGLVCTAEALFKRKTGG